MSSFLKNKNKRLATPINEKLEALINELSSLLSPIQEKSESKFIINKYPLGFVVGCPRSGTTVFTQWIAGLGNFSYPSNLLNRFAYAPYIGALIQKMLFDPEYNYANEFHSNIGNRSFKSELGKTIGYTSPNEFQYFFRKHMKNFDPEYLTEANLAKVNFKGIIQGLSSIEAVFDKPFICKLIMLQYNIEKVHNQIPNSIFFYIKRDPLLNMQSILNARSKYYGDKKTWWSVKPPEYNILKNLDVHSQIAGQVYYTNRHIENTLEDIPDNNKIMINYEEFCEKPHCVYDQILEKYYKNGFKISESYLGVKSFIIKNKLKLSKSDVNKFVNAYNRFANA